MVAIAKMVFRMDQKRVVKMPAAMFVKLKQVTKQNIVPWRFADFMKMNAIYV